MEYYRGEPFNYCYLEDIGVNWKITNPVEDYNVDDIQSYEVSVVNKNFNPKNILSPMHIVYCPSFVKTADGKYAFPVYEVVEIFDKFGDTDESDYHVIGWCVMDTDPFSELK